MSASIIFKNTPIKTEKFKDFHASSFSKEVRNDILERLRGFVSYIATNDFILNS